MLPWTLHRGGVLDAGKTTSSENSSVEVQSKHSVEEIPAWRHSKTIEFSIHPKRFRFGLSDDRDCDSFLQARHLQAKHLFKCFQEFRGRIGFLYLSKE